MPRRNVIASATSAGGSSLGAGSSVQFAQRPHGVMSTSSSCSRRKRHQARVGALVREHRRRFLGARRLDSLEPRGVVVPRRGSAFPAFGRAGDRAFDVEHLQQRVEPAGADVRFRLDRVRAHRCTRVLDDVEHRFDQRARGERSRVEVVPDGAIFVAGKEHDVRGEDGAPGPPDGLVVRDRRRRRLVVHDEREVGLVVAHRERGRRDDDLELVGPQRGLDALPFGRLGLPGIGGRVDAACPQPIGDPLRVADGEAIHDAAAGQRRNVVREPSETLGALGHDRNRQPQ